MRYNLTKRERYQRKARRTFYIAKAFRILMFQNMMNESHRQWVEHRGTLNPYYVRMEDVNRKANEVYDHYRHQALKHV